MRGRKDVVRDVMQKKIKTADGAREIGVSPSRMRQIVRKARATGVIDPGPKSKMPTHSPQASTGARRLSPPASAPVPPPEPGSTPPPPPGADSPAVDVQAPPTSLDEVMKRAGVGATGQGPTIQPGLGVPSPAPGAPPPPAGPELVTYAKEDLDAARDMVKMAREEMIETLAEYNYGLDSDDPELVKLVNAEPRVLKAAIARNPEKASKLGGMLAGWKGLVFAFGFEFISVIRGVRKIARKRGLQHKVIQPDADPDMPDLDIPPARPDQQPHGKMMSPHAERGVPQARRPLTPSEDPEIPEPAVGPKGEFSIKAAARAMKESSGYEVPDSLTKRGDASKPNGDGKKASKFSISDLAKMSDENLP